MQSRHVLLFHYVPTTYSKRQEDIQTDRQTPDLAETAVPIPSAYFKTHMLILSDL